MSELYFLNGRSADNSLFNRALFFGEGVFETFRWKGKIPVFIDNHLKRLKNSAKLLGIPFPDESILTENIENAVNESNFDDIYVKLCLISEGDSNFASNSERSSVVVVVKKQPEIKEDFSVCVSKIKRNQFSPLNTVKSFNYLESILAKREAMKSGFDDSIFLNINDEIVETSSCNVFWVRGKSLFTPSLNCGLLPGITREIILNIADKIGFEVNERKFKLPYLLNSDFAFLTNASAGCIYVSKINNQVMPVKNEDYMLFRDNLIKKLEW